jgi:hypothetical protein
VWESRYGESLARPIEGGSEGWAVSVCCPNDDAETVQSCHFHEAKEATHPRRSRLVGDVYAYHTCKFGHSASVSPGGEGMRNNNAQSASVALPWRRTGQPARDHQATPREYPLTHTHTHMELGRRLSEEGPRWDALCLTTLPGRALSKHIA